MKIEDFNKLNESNLRKVVGRLVSAGNKRLRTFERHGESSPATRYVTQHGGVFSTKGKNLNQLRIEYVRAKQFLQSETSTYKGYQKVKQETISSLKKEGISLSKRQFEEFWNSYEKLKEVDRSVTDKRFKYVVLNAVSEQMEGDNKTSDEIVNNIGSRLNELYEESQREESDGSSRGGVSQFFKLE
jgi:hypothetical protein